MFGINRTHLPAATAIKTTVLPLCLITLLLCSFTYQQAKTYPYAQWTKEELEKANTAKNVSYLTEEEKQVIYYTNLARINPKLFGETYAQQYIDTALKRSGYTVSLLNDLKKQKVLSALLPDSVLSKTAADWAASSGKKGETGHAGHDARYDKVKDRFPHWGENCDYGFNDALSIVMRLLIDEGHSDLGHRKAILNSDYTHIGTAIRKHKKYDWDCVQDFGGE